MHDGCLTIEAHVSALGAAMLPHTCPFQYVGSNVFSYLLIRLLVYCSIKEVLEERKKSQLGPTARATLLWGISSSKGHGSWHIENKEMCDINMDNVPLFVEHLNFSSTVCDLLNLVCVT